MKAVFTKGTKDASLSRPFRNSTPYLGRAPHLCCHTRRSLSAHNKFSDLAFFRFFQHFFFNFPSKIIVQVYCCHTISKHVVHHYHAPFRCGRFASIKDGQVERRDNDAVCQLGHMLWLWYVSPPLSLPTPLESTHDFTACRTTCAIA